MTCKCGHLKDSHLVEARFGHTLCCHPVTNPDPEVWIKQDSRTCRCVRFTPGEPAPAELSRLWYARK